MSSKQTINEAQICIEKSMTKTTVQSDNSSLKCLLYSSEKWLEFAI